jgi:hypothetical protein
MIYIIHIYIQLSTILNIIEYNRIEIILYNKI